MTALQLHNPQAILPRCTDGISVEDGLREFKALLEDSMKESTKTTYQSEIRAWVKFCRNDAGAQAHSPFPVQPELVVSYVGAMATAGRKPNGMKTALAALRKVQRLYFRDAPDPITDHVKQVIERYKREQPRQLATRRAKPLVWEDVLALVRSCPNDLEGIRNRAIFTVLYTNALRVRECASVDVSDIKPLGHWLEGYELDIPLHKTVQKAGAGRTITSAQSDNGIDCPVHILREWMTLREEKLAEVREIWDAKISKELRKGSPETVAAKYREMLGSIVKKPETEVPRELKVRVKRALQPDGGTNAHKIAEIILSLESQALFLGLNRHGQLTGRRIDARSINRILMKVAGRLVEGGEWEHEMLDAISSHSFRRGIATWAVENGVDVSKVSIHLRHSSEKTTRVYINEANTLPRGLNGALNSVDQE